MKNSKRHLHSIIQECLTRVLNEGRKPNVYWDDYERCKAEASKYKGRAEFHIKNNGAWKSAQRHGWLGEFFGDPLIKPSGYWDDYERCKAEASKYRGREEFRRRNSAAYVSAKEHGWLDEFFGDPLIKPSGYWDDYERSKAEASKYRGREEFHKGNPSAYQSAQRHGWLDEFFGKSFKKPSNYWNYDRCKAEASKYRGRKEFQIGNKSAYQSARNNGWLDEFFGERDACSYAYWSNYDRCKAEAKRYPSRTSMQRANSSAYHAAFNNGWLNDFFGEHIIPPNIYWNYDRCRAEAKKYRNRTEFARKALGAYGQSRQNGWIDEFFPKKKRK